MFEKWSIAEIYKIARSHDFWKNTNVKRSVYVNTILSSFWNDSIDIFMRYPGLKIMSVFQIPLKSLGTSHIKHEKEVESVDM